MIAGSLEIQLLANMARLQQDMDNAKRAVGGAMSHIERTVEQAKNALGLLGGVLSVSAFAGFVKGAIDAADNLNDLSKSTGLAVEQLAGLKLAAQQSGGDLEEAAKGINKLSQNIGSNAEKYAKIGITAKEPLEAFKQLSDIFRRIEDPQKRAAFGAEALGKSWAGSAPLLAEGSEKIQEMVDKGARLSGMTQGAADGADEFNDRLTELKTMLGGVALNIAKDVMPVMTALAESMVSGKDDTDDLALAFPKLSEVLRTFIVMGGNVAFVLAGVGREIGGIAAQAAAMLSGDFKAAFGLGGIGDMMTDDAEKARAAFDKWEAKMLSAGTVAVVTAAKVEDAVNKETKAQSAATDAFIAGAAQKSKAAESALDKFIADAAQREALLNAESAAVEKLTDAEKWALATMVKMRDGKLGQNEAERELIAARIQQVLVLEKQNSEEKRLADLEEKALGRRAEQIEADQKNAESIREATKSMREQTAEIGLTDEALLALRLSRVDDQIETEAWRLSLLGGTEAIGAQADAIRDTIAALQDRKNAMVEQDRAEKVAKEIKSLSEAWEKLTDNVKRSLTDSIMRGFDDGKPFVESFFDSLENYAKTTVLTFGVNLFTNGAGQIVGSLGNTAINGLLGTSGANNGGGTDYLGIANNASTLNTAYGLYSQGWGATAGNMISGAGNLLGSSGMAAYGSGYSAGLSGVSDAIAAYNTAAANAVAAGDASQALIYSNTASSLAAGGSAPGAGLGGAAPAAPSSSGLGASAVGWIAAIVMGMYMSGEAWQNGIRWENYAKDDNAKKYDAEVGIRAAHDEPARAIFGDEFVESKFYAVMSGSSLSAQIHGAIQKGLWGGDWAPDGSDSRLSGTFNESSQGFDSGKISQDFHKDGGWFRRDKKETRSQDVSSGLDSGLDQMYRTIRNSMVMAGAVFEDHTLAEKLKGFTLSITDLSGSKLDESLTKASDQLAETMGKLLFPSIDAMRVNVVEQASALKNDLEQAKRTGNVALASNIEAQIKNLEGLDNESWSSAFGRIMQSASAVGRVLDLMGDSITDAFGEGNANRVLLMSESLVQMFGGVDKLNSSFSAYYANFYSQEEQRAQAMEDMGKAFTSLNQTMPTSREGFRDIVDGLDLATVGGQATFKALMDLQGGFAQLVPSIEKTTKSIEAIASERKSLQDEYDSLTMTSTELLTKQRNALDESNRSLFDQVNLLKKQRDASDAAVESYNSIMDAAKSISERVKGISTSVSESIFGMQYGLKDNAGKYDMLDVRGATLNSQMRGATDIYDIAGFADTLIGTLNQAWSLLEPEQQKTQILPFEEKLNAINDFVMQKGADPVALAKAQAAETAKTIAEAVKKAIAEAMADPTSALAKAAADVKAAANTPAQANISVTVTAPVGSEVSVA